MAYQGDVSDDDIGTPEADIESVEINDLHIPGNKRISTVFDTENTVIAEVRRLVREQGLQLRPEQYALFVRDREGRLHELEHQQRIDSVSDLLNESTHVELLPRGDEPSMEPMSMDSLGINSR